jgi:signal peptidase II
MNDRARSAAIIAAVVVVDRLTKIYIRSAFSIMDFHPIIPNVFNIVHIENRGAGFGMLAESQSHWRPIFLVGVSLVVMSAIVVMLWRPPRPAESIVLRIGLALVFGGALGNLWDRIFAGTVTDFLQVFIGSYEFPSFNAADSAITIGAGLLLIDLWRTRNHPAS